MELLRGAIRTYAWGSRTAIAEFTGRPVPAAHPEAELWLGAHPADPARVETADGERSLLDVVRSDPEGQLGAAVCAQFGDVLPFLVKVLAADEPLSLQAHPSTAQAVEGFAREDRMGVSLNSPVRNYRDRSHKPEILVALETFEALAGFPAGGAHHRTAARAGRFRNSIPLSRCCPASSTAMSPTPTGCGHCSRPGSPPHSLISICSCPPCSTVRSTTCVLTAVEFADEARTVLELGERYPGDAGVLASLLLNRVHLEAGEAIYLPAGNLHSYLRGVGVEVMANSDNVLRGGLTPKARRCSRAAAGAELHPGHRAGSAPADRAGRLRT